MESDEIPFPTLFFLLVLCQKACCVDDPFPFVSLSSCVTLWFIVLYYFGSIHFQCHSQAPTP